MKLFPAIDLYEKKVVRLKMGDYSQMTVYSDNPVEIAIGFQKCGAEFLHVVDLEGAKFGTTPNIGVIEEIVRSTSLKVEVGGGIRNESTVEKYLDAGVFRVILGTAAVENPDFLKRTVEKYGSQIAVGVDIKDGIVATHGWVKASGTDCFAFCRELEKIGVSTIIVTDISRISRNTSDILIFSDEATKHNIGIETVDGENLRAMLDGSRKFYEALNGAYAAMKGGDCK